MNEIPEIARFLRGLPGFEVLDDAQIADCAKNIEIAYYRKGERYSDDRQTRIAGCILFEAAQSSFSTKMTR